MVIWKSNGNQVKISEILHTHAHTNPNIIVGYIGDGHTTKKTHMMSKCETRKFFGRKRRDALCKNNIFFEGPYIESV